MSIDMLYTAWRERAVVGGGVKWQLIDSNTGENVVLATIVRLPGTLARAYLSDVVGGGIVDYPSVPAARKGVEARLSSS